MSAILPFTYQNLLKFLEIWQSSDRNKYAQFFRHAIVLSCTIFEIFDVEVYDGLKISVKGHSPCKCILIIYVQSVHRRNLSIRGYLFTADSLSHSSFNVQASWRRKRYLVNRRVMVARDHPRSAKLVPVERRCAVFYSSIVNIMLICYRFWDITAYWSKLIRSLRRHAHPVSFQPLTRSGCPLGPMVSKLVWQNLSPWAIPEGENRMILRFLVLTHCDWQTDRRPLP